MITDTKQWVVNPKDPTRPYIRRGTRWVGRLGRGEDAYAHTIRPAAGGSDAYLHNEDREGGLSPWYGHLGGRRQRKEILEHTLDTLTFHGIGYVVAGGAARDTYYGEEPKDYDIFIFDGQDKTTENLAVSSLLKESRMIDNQTPELLHRYEKAPLHYILKLQGVDIIGAYGNNVQGVLNTFDYNLNQFIFVGHPRNQDVVYMGDRGPEPTHLTRLVRSEVTKRRQQRMKELANFYGLTVTGG